MCIWYGKCDILKEICDDFSPIDMDSLIEQEYKEDLLYRNDVYWSEIDEL